MAAKLKQVLGYFDYFYLASFPILSIFGATQKYDNWTLPISIAASLSLLGFWLIRGKKIEIPKNFILYLLFVSVLSTHFLIFKGSFSYTLLFLSGGLVWLAIYNLRQIATKYYFSYLVGLGLVIAVISYILMLKGVTFIKPNNLFLPLGTNILHNHIGDVWAIVLLAVLYKAFQKLELWQIPLILLATVFIAQSFSRSAMVALIAGIFFIYQTSFKRKGGAMMFSIVLISLVTLFVAVSAFKTTLFSRPYLFETVNSFIKTPLGIGIGNFITVSKSSSMAHSIILELIADLGIFSAIFILWLIKVLKSILRKYSNILENAVFLAIFVNLSFDTTYSIPTMIWLWFSTLALTETGS